MSKPTCNRDRNVYPLNRRRRPTQSVGGVPHPVYIKLFFSGKELCVTLSWKLIFCAGKLSDALYGPPLACWIIWQLYVLGHPTDIPICPPSTWSVVPVM